MDFSVKTCFKHKGKLADLVIIKFQGSLSLTIHNTSYEGENAILVSQNIILKTIKTK